MKAWCALGVGMIAALASARPADAKDPALRYRQYGDASPKYLRATIEELGVLGLGYLQYTSDKNNAEDWDLGYDWRSFRSKLVLDSIGLDDNRFNTNWLGHPGGGFLYYSVARGNRLSLFASFAMAIAASTVWEYVGEIREQAAINDLIATPVSSLPLGESTMQIGAFFQRSRPSLLSTSLAWFFAPFKSVHDAIDHLDVRQADAVDDLGLDDDAFHRFVLGFGVGVTKQEAGTTALDYRVGFYSRLVTIPGFGHEGSLSTWFTAGEVSNLEYRTAISRGDIVDFRLASDVMPTGFVWQDIECDKDGGLHGNSLIVGMRVAAEYELHDYDRDRRQDSDRIALVAAGASGEDTLHVGPLLVRGRLDALATFGGVSSYALTAYRGAYDAYGLSSVIRGKGYYHSYGGTLRSLVELETGPLHAGGDIRIDVFNEIRGLDNTDGRIGPEVDAGDHRIVARTWLGIMPTRHLRLSVVGELRDRGGSVADVHVARRETTLYGATEIVF